MRKRQGLIIRVLLGWWLFCLAGQCLSLPLYQSLDPAPSHQAGMAMSGDADIRQDCHDDGTRCEGSTFPAIFLLLLAAALPLLFWLGVGEPGLHRFVALTAFRVRATGPPVYLLSQRFRE